MQEAKNYKETVKKLYSKISSFDDQNYIYSLRNPVGFYQRMIVLKGLIEILNRNNNIKLSEFNSILDLGCGVGYWLRVIAEIRGNAEGLIGIDLSEERLNYAKKINKNIKWIKADICNLPFEDESFDFVTAFVSLMFLTDNKSLKRGVKELARVLRNGGMSLFYDVLGKRKLSGFTRGFQIKKVKDLFDSTGLKLVDKQSCFKNIFGLRRLNTAYLASKIPMEILFLLEKLYFSKPNNVFLLFLKENKL